MKSKFSASWVKSKQPRKQRKYRLNAPIHIRGKFLGAHLSKDLRAKYNTRSVRVAKGDKVKIMKGSFKKKEGKVDRVNTKNGRVYVIGVEIIKRDGSKAFVPVNASNLMIIDLNLNDKRRKNKLEGLKNGKKSSEKTE